MFITAKGKFLILAAYILTKCRSVSAQCDGKIRTISEGSGSIQSPNYGDEYNKSANCTWLFSAPNDGKIYLLNLTVIKLRMYFLNRKLSDKKYCSRSYNLTVNNVQTECEYVDSDQRTSYCYAFYKSSTCFSSCKFSKQVSNSVGVTYLSDGGLVPSSDYDAKSTWGFKMNYKYTECQTDTTTSVGSISVTSEMNQAALTTTTPFEQDSRTTVHTATNNSDKQGGKETSEFTKFTTTDFTTSEFINSPELTVIISAAAGGGVLMIVALIVIIVCIKKRSKILLVDDVQLDSEPGREENGIQNDGHSAKEETTVTTATSNVAQQSPDIQHPDNVVYYTSIDVAATPNQAENEDMYSVVTQPSTTQPTDNDQEREDSSTAIDSTKGGATPTNKTCQEMYSTVHEPTKQTQETRKYGETQNTEETLYSSVDKNSGTKQTVRYKKAMVDNILYGSTT